MIIVLFGAPGVGKGTQAAVLATSLNIAHLSTGDAFRSAIAAASPVGILAKQYVESGALVPDDVVAKIVAEALASEKFAQGAILDGFPRTKAQADALEEILASKNQVIHKVVNIDVSADTITERLLQRGRTDDTEDVIRYRLDVYTNETKPLLEYYSEKGALVTVDGLGTVEEVTNRILQAIG